MAQADGAPVHNSRAGRTANAGSLIFGLWFVFSFSNMNAPQSKIKGQRPKTKGQITAILLAAGRSRRMGSFKPLLPFGNSTVVESCVNNLREAGVDEIIVVVGYRADDVRRQLKTSGVEFAVNPDPDSEMSASIARGVELIKPNAEVALIALVDQPAVTGKVIRRLIDEW